MSTPCQSPATLPAQQIPPSFADKKRKERHRDVMRASRARRRAQLPTERREALSCAEAVKELLPQYPTLRDELNKFITLLQKHGRVQPDRVKDLVELKLSQGCTHVDEICEETNLSELVILNTLEAMRALGTVAHTQRRVGGRPTQEMIWVLTGKVAITSAVRP